MISTAFASAAANSQSSALGFLPIILLFVIFYFFMIRPQQKRIKEHKEMVTALKKGDTIVTGGGIVGKIVKAEDDILEVEIASNTTIKILRSTITSKSEEKFKPAATTATKAKAKTKKKATSKK